MQLKLIRLATWLHLLVQCRIRSDIFKPAIFVANNDIFHYNNGNILIITSIFSFVFFCVKMTSNKWNLCYLPMAAHRASTFSRHVFMAGKRNALIMDDLGHSPLYYIRRENRVDFCEVDKGTLWSRIALIFLHDSEEEKEEEEEE